jgi:hypothetical protein
LLASLRCYLLFPQEKHKDLNFFTKCISRAQTVRPCLDQQRNMKS